MTDQPKGEWTGDAGNGIWCGRNYIGSASNNAAATKIRAAHNAAMKEADEHKFSGGTRLDCGTFIPPKPTTGEWTADRLQLALLTGSYHSVAAEINAALAAERERLLLSDQSK